MKNITENIIIITNTLLHNDIYYKCCRWPFAKTYSTEYFHFIKEYTQDNAYSKHNINMLTSMAYFSKENFGY